MKDGDLDFGQAAASRPRTTGTIIAGLLEVTARPVEIAPVPRFATREKFVLDRGGEVPISYIGEDFTAHFLPLVEAEPGGATLMQYTLLQGSVDVPIFAALGGQDHARIALAHLFEFLKVADRTRWYFSYVSDAQGKLWAIDMYWRDHGWDLEAYSVTYPRGWRGGGCVVSGPV